jgi:hypothetical protein
MVRGTSRGFWGLRALEGIVVGVVGFLVGLDRGVLAS